MIKLYYKDDLNYININNEQLNNLKQLEIKKYSFSKYYKLIIDCDEIKQNIKIDIINDKLYINNNYININNYIKNISITNCILNNIDLNIINSNFLKIIEFNNYKNNYIYNNLDFSNLKINIINSKLNVFYFNCIINNLNQLLNNIKNLNIDFNNILFQFNHCILEEDNINIFFIKHISLEETIFDLNKLFNLNSLLINKCSNIEYDFTNLYKHLNLKNLQLVNYKEIKFIPDNLINLKYLKLCNCNIKEIHNSLINLKYLELKDYNINNKLLNKIINLKYLKLYNCNIKKIPNNLINLKELILEDCNDIKIPNTLINLRKLTIIKPNYNNYINYYKLPNTLINLKYLKLGDFIFKNLSKTYIKLKELIICYDFDMYKKDYNYYKKLITKQEIKKYINNTNGLKIKCYINNQLKNILNNNN